jgi:type VI secretion system protein ImpK
MNTETLTTQTPAFHIPIPEWVQAAMLQPKATLTHLPLAQPQGGYYRSKLLTSQIGINPLLTAAAALLTFIAKLYEQALAQDIPEVYATLIHETKAFEAAAQQQGYRAEHVLVARYLLCATLDEALMAMGNSALWQKHKLLQHFHGELCGDERFFLILDRLSVEPAMHIDLLELIYLCLSLGFTGKYRQRENGKAELDVLMGRLYERIRAQRGAIKKALGIQEKSAEIIAPPVPTRPPPLWLLISFTAFLFLTLYFGFNFLLESNVTPLYQELTSIAQNYADD